MASARRLKRAAASQAGFLTLNSNLDPSDLVSSRRKRVNKNKKKSWKKHSDINDVEEFLEDIRHQERTAGGLLSEKSDESLFFLDVGDTKKDEQKVPQTVLGKGRRGKTVRPLRIDLILQHDSKVPPPKDILAYQQPNAKKLRRIAEKAEKLAAKGVVPRKQRMLLNKRPAVEKVKKAVTEANNNPGRDYYDIWGQEVFPSRECEDKGGARTNVVNVRLGSEDMEIKDSRDSWYLQQTGKKRVQRPPSLYEKPSVLPAVEVIAPGGSYNPDFLSHQALLQEAHEVEVKKQKQEERIQRQLAVRREDRATEETIFHEQVEGLIVDEDDEKEEAPPKPEREASTVADVPAAEKKSGDRKKKEKKEKTKKTVVCKKAEDSNEKEEKEATPNPEEGDSTVTAITVAEKKTERQRKKEKAEKIKAQQRLASKRQTERQQQLFQLRSIKSSIKRREERTKVRQMRRKAKQEAEKSQPRRLGRLKFQPPDMEIKLSDELAGSLRQLKPEGSVLKDRFKSMQKRNLIEPRERAKFKRKLKVKYVEKRAFREIT